MMPIFRAEFSATRMLMPRFAAAARAIARHAMPPRLPYYASCRRMCCPRLGHAIDFHCLPPIRRRYATRCR